MMILVMIGKLGFVVVFVVIYVFFVEFYLMVVRNVGMGVSFCCVCIGGIFVFYVVDLVKFFFDDKNLFFEFLVFK